MGRPSRQSRQWMLRVYYKKMRCHVWHVHRCCVRCASMCGWTSACSQYIYGALERTVQCSAVCMCLLKLAECPPKRSYGVGRERSYCTTELEVILEVRTNEPRACGSSHPKRSSPAWVLLYSYTRYTLVRPACHCFLHPITKHVVLALTTIHTRMQAVGSGMWLQYTCKHTFASLSAFRTTDTSGSSYLN